MLFISYITTITLGPLLCLLALVKGDRAERYGALIFFVPAALESALFPIARHFGYYGHLPYLDLITTFAISAGFLYLAIRYANLWLALAMMVQGTELYFARTAIDANSADYRTYCIEINTITAFVALTLGIAALWSWRRRAQKTHEDAKRVAVLAERELARERKFQAMFESRPSPARPAAPVSRGVARFTIEPPPL